MSKQSTKRGSVDAEEIEKFSNMADEWWDPTGKFKPLHALNKVRLGYIREQLHHHLKTDLDSLAPYKGLKMLDIGCGGGLLCEPLSRLGADVTGIDPAPVNIDVAKHHADSAGLAINYQATTAEDLAAKKATFDVVFAMEVIEHVADIPSFMQALQTLVKPGGYVFMSTINRTVKSMALAKIMAEYVLRWLPVGTHDWQKFVTPAELTDHLSAQKLTVLDTTGVGLNITKWPKQEWQTCKDLSVNYMLLAKR